MSSGDDVSFELETQFVYQPGDEDVLWEVKEITGERGNKYRVKWAGIDPDTGKEWAQSWVPKHDCTDDIVIDWKARKKRLAAGKKRGRGTSTASRTSGASKQANSLTSGSKTRRSTTKATSSRPDSVKQHVSPPPPPPPPPPKQSTSKRKLQPETPATTTMTTGGAVNTEDESRPRKKQKTIVEVLLPPISSDEEEEEEELHLPARRAKETVQNEVARKRIGAVLDEDDSSQPRAKNKSERRSDARSKGAAAAATAVGSRASDAREEPRLLQSKTKGKDVARRKERVADVESEDEEDLRPPNHEKKSSPKRKSPPEQNDNVSEKEVQHTAPPIKIGPPRGVKRREKVRVPGPSSKPGPSRVKPLEDGSAGERVLAERSTGQIEHRISSSGGPPSRRQNTADTQASPSVQIPIPRDPPRARPRSPDLSPGAIARLELFDRMMGDEAAPPLDTSEHVLDDSHVDFNDIYDAHDAVDVFDPPPPPSPPPSKSKPKRSKLGTPNGLVVPETESSGNFQSQSPRKPLELPTITVIAASGTSTSVSPRSLPLKLPSVTNRPSKKSMVKVASSTFRPTINARSRVDDSEPPLSSIESFTSPKHVDKGKQRAIEDDQLWSTPSEGVQDGARPKKRPQLKVTDSQLKKRGKELFDQAQIAREAEWQKIKKPKRLKTVDEIVNGTVSLPSKGSPLPVTGAPESTTEMRMEDVVDLSGGANSATLDTPEHSEARPLSEETRERLRIELRQEEEENTQEAMGIYPPPPVKESEAINGEDAQMPPPRSPKNSPFGGQVEDVDHVEQPSTDILLASVIVQPSQEQCHEETDLDPSPANPPPSSPPRLIPENLTDSPRRRLGEALSLLNVKSEEIQRLERELADERENAQGLKAELAELRQSSEPTGPVRAAWDAERAQWAQDRSKWENDLALWETQRREMLEEKANLSARLAELSDAAVRAEESRVGLAQLEAERDVWTKERELMLNDMAQRLKELAKLANIREEYTEYQSKCEAEKMSWAEEKERWETERAALQEKQETLSRSVDELAASAESMRAAKVAAENDRDFFREQYVQASEFVSSVREENEELEKRVRIAEGQAQEGVAAIKALFEGRVKALQADVDRWKGLTELLQEKDRRTNDELRLRAAQAPELVELCGRLSGENKSLEADLRKLGQAQRRSVLQRNKLFYEILLLKKERASLRSKLSRLTNEAGGSTQEISHSAPPASPMVDDPENIDPNDMDILPESSSNATSDDLALFPCMWRPQLRDQCQHIFDAKEDLERHMREHFRDLQVR